MNNLKSHFSSVAWSFVYLLLLLSLPTTLNVVTIFFITVPALIMYTTLSKVKFISYVLGVWIVAGVLCTLTYNHLHIGLFVILQAIFFMIPALVMGHLYKTRVSAIKVILGGTISILLASLGILVIGASFFNFNLATNIQEIISLAMANVKNVADSPIAGSALLAEDLPEQLSAYAMHMLPFTLIICSFLIAAVAHTVSRPTLSSMGVIVHKLPKIREWRLPRSLVFYYLISVIVTIVIGPEHNLGFLSMIFDNLIPLLRFLFILQAASFIFFLSHFKRWDPALAVVLLVVMLFVPLGWLIGVLDVALPLRESITRSRR